MSKIDERTVVPLMWLVSGFTLVASMTAVSAFWVATVNLRLSRIEQKLGIPPLKSADRGIMSTEAKANEK